MKYGGHNNRLSKHIISEDDIMKIFNLTLDNNEKSQENIKSINIESLNSNANDLSTPNNTDTNT